MFVAVVRGERNDCFLLSCMIFLSRKIHLELLQCFLYLEIHCSNLKKKKNWKSFAFRGVVGVSFWCVCSPKLVLENLLEML